MVGGPAWLLVDSVVEKEFFQGKSIRTAFILKQYIFDKHLIVNCLHCLYCKKIIIFFNKLTKVFLCGRESGGIFVSTKEGNAFHMMKTTCQRAGNSIEVVLETDY